MDYDGSFSLWLILEAKVRNKNSSSSFIIESNGGIPRGRSRNREEEEERGIPVPPKKRQPWDPLRETGGQ